MTIRDEDISVELWVRVIDWAATDDGMYVWHGHVTTAEEGWSSIVDHTNS